ncbi:neurotrypsin isoform X2 [Emydura macquarii macquarii]|uniref:neurotrypsin isoform X2 n=1 Tax=Emydura macquarii macquarii TaxID=1129001 RepID=UPI00352B6A05
MTLPSLLVALLLGTARAAALGSFDAVSPLAAAHGRLRPRPLAQHPHPRPHLPDAPREEPPAAPPHQPGCPAGDGPRGRFVNVTEFGAACLPWAEVPAFVAKTPSGSGLRGRHNFCRNPDGRSRPWCFYRNPRGRLDWGYCDCKQGSVRLRGGKNEFEGTVEVYLNGIWGTICSSHWDNNDASVICRQLELGKSGTANHTPFSGLGLVPVYWSDVRCHGDEENILLCEKDIWQGGSCPQKMAAAVTCRFSHAAIFTPIRLTGGSSANEGRVEVYHAGQWGTVCDDQWDDADAEVVCRQLGLGGVAKAWSQAYFGEGSGPVLLDEVRCTGNELSIEQCPKSSWREHNCGHKEDAGVSCTPLTGPPIRLMDGENKKEGRVEIFINGQWGTICDDGWSDKDAAVVCRQLGYKGPARARTMAYFGEGKGPIHVDNVKCTGNERSLTDCIKQDIGTHNCRHSEDAGVICDYLGKKASGNSNKDSLTSVCGLRLLHRRQKRIIGGKNSLRGGWPWQVALRLKSSHGDGRLLCGATLISSCWVLTAAHCFKRYGNNTRNYAVRVGDYHTLVPEEYEDEIGVQQIVMHKEYRPDSNDYDIALVRLHGPEEQCARFSTHVLPACLPLRRERPQKTAPNCYITGWGDTGRAYSRTLQQAAIPLLPKRLCEERYKKRFTGRMLCAGNLREQKHVDSCQGDSGGPLMCERPGESWVVYGVTSWGYGCGIKDSPGVYTKVSSFVPWIKNVTKL